MKTPVSIITGYLGAGKTTLLRRIIGAYPGKLAVLMNEFGSIGIDGQVIKGKDVDMIELLGGCVCCSLSGEFEAAIKEIIGKAKPEMIVVETTGVAEPDAILIDLEGVPEVRLDSVITIVDCDAMLRFPLLGHTGRVQIELADVILMNKTDLVEKKSMEETEKRVKEMNGKAVVHRVVKCNVEVSALFGISPEKKATMGKRNHLKEEGIEIFPYGTAEKFDRKRFERFLGELKGVYRAKGFVNFPKGTFLFNYVNGRWDFEKLGKEKTRMVFIGKDIKRLEKSIEEGLKGCET